MGDYLIGDEFASEWNRVRHKVDNLVNETIGNNGSSAQRHPEATILKVTGDVEDGGTGRYLAYVIFGFTNSTPADLSLTDLGNVGTKQVEVWNLPDIASGGSSLNANDPVLGFLKGYNKNTGMPVYISSQGGALPKGQYQYMLFQMVSQNQTGWDYARSHPMVGT